MADEITSGAPSGGAAPSSGSGSAPTTSSPTTSTPATGIAQPQPVATPVAPAPTGPPTKTPGEPDDKFLARFHEYEDKQPKVEEPVVEEPKPVASEPPKEIAKPEPVKEEVKAEPAKAAEPNPLDDMGPLPASKLAELLTANPELDKALEEAGIKDDLFANAREAAEGLQFKQEFNGDIETAKYAKSAAITLGKMDLAATELKPGDMPSTVKFVQEVLMPMSYILDENGDPKMIDVKQGDGSVVQTPQTDGTVQTLLENVASIREDQRSFDANRLLNHPNEAVRERAERALAAVQELVEFDKFLGNKGDPSEDLPEHLKAEAAKIQSERDSMTAAKVQEADQRYNTFKNDTMEAVNSALNGEIDGFLKDTTLAPDSHDSQQAKDSKQLLRDTITSKIRDGLFAHFNRNELFLAEQEQKGRRGYTAAVKASLVNHYVRKAQSVLQEIATPILASAGYEKVRQSAARAAKIAAQQKVSQMEPQGMTRPSVPTAQKIDEQALMREAKLQLTKETGREPQPSEMIARWRQLVAKASTAA